MLPDHLTLNFDAILKTDWSKPQLDSKTKKSAISPVVMLISVFFPWCSITWGGEVLESYLGIQTWCGVLALIVAAIALAGTLYKHRSLSFWGAVAGVVFGLFGTVVVPGATAEGLEFAEAMGTDFSHFGAYPYLIASVVTGVIAYKGNE